MNIKETFLKLTSYEIPYGHESKLLTFFPKNTNTDELGNFWIKIGESKTMFCAHLDTYSREYRKVKHIINKNIISTDETTVLGADDKAGITIMLYMIEHNIPGLYYFFRGEEGLLAPTSTWGSKNALKKYADKFKNYDKCIAFDRKKKYSVITHQMWQECCSPEFSKALIEEFKKAGMPYQEDDGGFWCDSGTFMENIPECTNLSVGYDNEHTTKEYQDIKYLEDLCEAAIVINWENLPVKRDPEIYTPSKSYSSKYDYLYDEDSGYSTFYKSKYNNKNVSKKDLLFTKNKSREYYTAFQMFQHVQDIVSDLDYECLNADYFADGVDMYFLHKDNNDHFLIKIEDFNISITEDDDSTIYTLVGDLDTFERYVKIGGYTDDNKSNDNSKLTGDDYIKKEYDTQVHKLNQLSTGLPILHSIKGLGYILMLDNTKMTIYYHDTKKYEDYYFDDVKYYLKIKSSRIDTKKDLSEKYDIKINNISEIKSGTYIYHTKFGEGVVIKKEGDTEDAKITIYFFEIDDNKTIAFKYGKDYLRLKLPF